MKLKNSFLHSMFIKTILEGFQSMIYFKMKMKTVKSQVQVKVLNQEKNNL